MTPFRLGKAGRGDRPNIATLRKDSISNIIGDNGIYKLRVTKKYLTELNDESFNFLNNKLTYYPQFQLFLLEIQIF